MNQRLELSLDEHAGVHLNYYSGNFWNSISIFDLWYARRSYLDGHIGKHYARKSSHGPAWIDTADLKWL